MKKFTLFTLILCGSQLFAQTPNWVNADYRSSNYPTNSYLVGYSEVFDVSKKQADDEISQLIDLSKSVLIQSVRVKVQSVSTSNVSDFNGEIDDYFNQKTTSQSNLQLIGLQTESYYDKKEQKAYAFSYVNKMKMVEYYRSEISKNISDISNIISQGQTLLDGGNIKNAYSNGLQAYNQFFVIDESQKVLMAIGASNDLDTRIDEVNELNNEFKNFMIATVSHRKMSIDDMGFIISKGLMKSQGDHHKNIDLLPFTYEQTGFSSQFSYKLEESIKQTLPNNTSAEGYAIQGVFFYKGDNVVVKSKLINLKTEKIVGSNTVQIPEINLISDNVVIIPKDIQSLEQLENISVVAKTTGAKGKAGLGLDKDLKALVQLEGKPFGGIPVSFVNNNDGTVYCSTVSDNNGMATCRVKKINGAYKNQVILAQVNMAEYLSSDTTEYVKSYMENKTIPKASFKVVVEPSTIYVQAQENNFGKSLDVKLIEPQIKESLAGYGFDFMDTDTNVDYVIKIRASSRRGGNVSGVYFAFVDVTISVYDNNLGKEIFKDSINNVKGGGGTFEQAGGKAYYAAADMAREKIVKILIQ